MKLESLRLVDFEVNDDDDDDDDDDDLVTTIYSPLFW